ncbi:MAG TPA: DUF4870 domain-containing protein [Opitutaceae bacterium]|nr:DUF4870 domain-containing protein [Opitutaceae bacterium]
MPISQPPVVSFTSSERLWSVLCHLSYFFGLALLAFLFPMVVYLVMRSDSAFVTHHAREALNFHLSLLVYALLCVPLIFIVVGIPLLVAIGIAGIVCSIVAAVKASEGVYYQYPLSIRFFR